MATARHAPRLAFGLLVLAALACNLTQSSSAPAPTATPILPTVSIIAPVDGVDVQVGQQVDIRSVASDVGGGVTRVALHVDGIEINHVEPSDGPQIYWTVQQAWTPAQTGSHTIEVIAYRGPTASAPAQVTLNVRETLAATPGQIAQSACTATVNAEAGLYVRTGPGTDYPHQYALSAGTTVSVVGRVGDNSWWQVQASDGLVGWVSGEYVDLSGNCRTVPVTQSPPTPTPTPTTLPASGSQPNSAPNLQVLNIEGPGQAVLSGGSVTATFVVTVGNVGADDSGQFDVTFYPQGRAGAASPQVAAVPQLGAGAAVTLTFNGEFSTPGQYVAEAYADSGRRVTESDETDNVRIFSLHVFASS